MTACQVRRARLADAEAIARFVNAARTGKASTPTVTPMTVAERFGQIGFMVAEQDGELVGLLGWQIENLVVRVTDYLVTTAMADPEAVGAALVGKMEEDSVLLQAEAALLFLPPNPSRQLVAFWQGLGYEFACPDDLHRACRDAVEESGLDLQHVMSKHLREDAVRRPM